MNITRNKQDKVALISESGVTLFAQKNKIASASISPSLSESDLCIIGSEVPHCVDENLIPEELQKLHEKQSPTYISGLNH